MKILLKVILLITILALPVLSYAPPGGSWNPGDTDPTVPISGGIVFLIASAIIYGVKKYISQKK